MGSYVSYQKWFCICSRILCASRLVGDRVNDQSFPQNEDEEPIEEGGKKGNKKKKAAEDDKVRKLSFSCHPSRHYSYTIT